MSDTEKRLKFRCWNCSRVYSWLRDLAEGMKLFTTCPFCDKEAVVDLTPYIDRTVDVFRSLEEHGAAAIFDALKLPDILPTQELRAENTNTQTP